MPLTSTSPAKKKRIPGISAQDRWLLNLKQNRAQVGFSLLSGSTVNGRIISFDRYALIIEQRNGNQLMLYKSAIATIEPAPTAQQAQSPAPPPTNGTHPRR